MSDYVNKKWYVHDGSKQSGPHPFEELRSLIAQKKVTPEMHVWCEGMANWSRLSDVEVLQFQPEKTPQSSPPPSSGASSPAKTPYNPPITNTDEVSMMLAVSKDTFGKDDRTSAIDVSLLKAVNN